MFPTTSQHTLIQKLAPEVGNYYSYGIRQTYPLGTIRKAGWNTENITRLIRGPGLGKIRSQRGGKCLLVNPALCTVFLSVSVEQEGQSNASGQIRDRKFDRKGHKSEIRVQYLECGVGEQLHVSDKTYETLNL